MNPRLAVWRVKSGKKSRTCANWTGRRIKRKNSKNYSHRGHRVHREIQKQHQNPVFNESNGFWRLKVFLCELCVLCGKPEIRTFMLDIQALRDRKSVV